MSIPVIRRFGKTAKNGSTTTQRQPTMSMYIAFDKAKELHKPATLDEAFKYYKIAADNGHAEAQWRVGDFYLRGYHVIEVNEKKAFEYFQKAAQQGLEDGCLSLGICYRDGVGTSIDLKKALYYLTISTTPNSETLWALAMCYKKLNQSQDTWRLIKEAAEQGHPRALMCLNAYSDEDEDN